MHTKDGILTELQSSKKVASYNWGIIGPGKIAHDFTNDLKLVQPAQHVTAVLGKELEEATDLAKEFEASTPYTDLDAFIRHEGLHIAYIATPHPQHYKEALACLQHKIPVLCEKPLTLNAAQANDLVQASKDNNCFLMEAMWIRFLPGIQKMMMLINEGTIGKVLSVKASMGFKAPKDGNSRYFNPAMGGGSLLDLGIYPLFLAHLLLGKPSTIKAAGRLSDKGVDEAAAILLDYNGKAQALLDASLLSQSDRPAEIAGEKGIIRIQHPWFEKSTGIELELYNGMKQVFPTSWDGHGLQFEIEEVVQCLDNKKIESILYPHAFTSEVSQAMDEIRNQIHVVYKDFE